MEYLTPPSTGRKKRGIFNKYRQPTYYEDIYGEMNKDEKLEGRPDRCDTESESDSDSEAVEGITERKVLQRTPKSLKRKRGAPDVDNGQDKGNGLFVSEDEDEDELARFKIAPKFNSRISVPLPVMPPRKFGMFAGQKHADNADMSVVSYPEPARSNKQLPELDEAFEPESGKRIRRPASRRLLKQQLAQHDKAKREALRVERASEKTAKEAAKEAKKLAQNSTQVGKKGKAAKGATKVHWKDVKHLVKANEKKLAEEKKRAKKSKKATDAPNSPIVLIDNSGIDPSEYRRYDARGVAVVK